MIEPSQLPQLLEEPPYRFLHQSERPRPSQESHLRGLFIRLIEPSVRWAFEQLERKIEPLLETQAAVPFDAATITQMLSSSLLERLDWLLSRTVVLEMQVARLSDRLEGATPKERFQSFLAWLEKPANLIDLFREYPVLPRLVIEDLGQWVDASYELLERLCSDWPLLRQEFFGSRDPGLLQGVSVGSGDMHGGGRSVCLLRFEHDIRLVYKPRPMQIDLCFARLLEWLNERGAPNLRAARVLNRGAYGWMEFVPAEPCRNMDELRRFYRRQGAFLALLHTLHANDFHRENLIAAGEHPVLVDLESIGSPDYGRSDPSTYDSMAHFLLNDSVMRVMLLPYFQENKDREVIDLSGLGGEEGQLEVHDSFAWTAAGTDEMRLVRTRGRTLRSANRPSLGGQAVDPLDFRSEIEEGFGSTYRLLLKHRSELLSEGSPLEAFEQAEVRVIFRPSQFYALILRERNHPDLLRDPQEMDRHFDNLWFGIERSHFAELSMRLSQPERADLWRGDIPCFRTRMRSLDVWTALGERVPGVFKRSGMEMIRRQIERLGPEDLEEQLYYVRTSLMAFSADVGFGRLRYSHPSGTAAADEARLLETARRAADRIVEQAKCFQGEASWIGLAEFPSRGWSLKPLDVELYGGLPGVMLFLSYFGEITGDDRYTRLAQDAMPTLRRRIDFRKRVRGLGGFDGWGGIVYAWLHLARLWRREEMLSEALDMLPKLEELADGDEGLDVLRGAAGAVVPLLSLARATGSGQAFDLARRLGERLLATAQPFDGGLAWLVGASPFRPLNGFSHGAAGIAWALGELFGATGDARYKETSLAAVAFENALFSPAAGNWPDLRGVPLENTPEGLTYMAAWCHGSCGIGMGRLRMLRHMEDARLENDARIAVETTLKKGFGFCHALCHGDLGCLDFLLDASRTLDSGLRDELLRKTGLVLKSIEEHGFLSGIPGSIETPGLLDGVAGIGYGLLRLAFPERVPSVLMLDPPPDEI